MQDSSALLAMDEEVDEEQRSACCMHECATEEAQLSKRMRFGCVPVACTCFEDVLGCLTDTECPAPACYRGQISHTSNSE
jgi:hypothetical protein